MGERFDITASRIGRFCAQMHTNGTQHEYQEILLRNTPGELRDGPADEPASALSDSVVSRVRGHCDEMLFCTPNRVPHFVIGRVSQGFIEEFVHSGEVIVGHA